MTDDKRESVIEKIRKLFALAERGGTEAEANTALRKAQELLALNKLSMSEVRATAENPIEEMGLFVGHKIGWRVYICGEIARLCFSESFFIPGKGMMVFIGRGLDVIAAKNLSSYVINTGETLSAGLNPWPQDVRAFRNSWRIGFAHRIAQRVAELIRAAKAGELKDSETGTELILHPAYARAEKDNAAYLGKFEMIPAKARPSVRDIGAYREGARAGDSVNLSTSGTIEGKTVKAIEA